MQTACSSTDPAGDFIRRTDRLPPHEQPYNWSGIKRRMLRHPPAVGQPAPDFTLKTSDGEHAITRSGFQADRPLVLIFGSLT